MLIQNLILQKHELKKVENYMFLTFFAKNTRYLMKRITNNNLSKGDYYNVKHGKRCYEGNSCSIRNR